MTDAVGRSGHANMSIDNALLHRVREGDAFLRLYRWDPPCLSFGRNESAASRYDRDAIYRLGLDTVRRPTGGRAVWHDAELTYAVAAPVDTFGSLRRTYVAIHEMLGAALRRLGVDAALAPTPPGREPGLSAGACFSSPAGGEVVMDGRKLIGSAQVRDGNAFLQHGSLLLENGQDVVSSVTNGKRPSVVAASLREVLTEAIGFEEVASAIAAEAKERWPGRWGEAPCALEVDGGDKFGQSSWTWRR